MAYPSPLENWQNPQRAFYFSVVIAVTLIWLLPIFLLLLTAAKTNDQINTEQGARFTWPEHWSQCLTGAEEFAGPLDCFAPEGFTTVFSSAEFWGSMGLSFMIVIPVVILSIGFASLAGYALAKHKFLGRTWIFALFVAGNFVPFQVLTFPVLRLLQDVVIPFPDIDFLWLYNGVLPIFGQGFTDYLANLFGAFELKNGSPYNSAWALIMFHAAFQTGFCVFFMRNFIAALPGELIEAARIEGANEYQIFTKVVLPLITPALAALGLLIFTFVWNDFYWSLVLTQGDLNLVPTMLVNLARGQWQNQWNVMAGGSILIALPPLVFFFFLQRQFVAGLTLGANKG